jgi:hypothetical protein
VKKSEAIHKTYWMPLWRSKNSLDGETQHLIFRDWQTAESGTDGVLAFRTRKACREYIRRVFGYIANRPDLKAEPHGWRMPQAVRVSCRIQMEPSK